MLRITEVPNGDESRLYLLEGKLLAPWVEEVSRLVASPGSPRRSVVLDLSRVSYVDEIGTRLLRELLGKGVVLRGCSAFVAELLRVIQAPSPPA